MPNLITIDAKNADKVAAGFAKAPAKTSRVMHATMEASTAVLEEGVVLHTPVGATAILAGSITTDITGSAVNLTGRVFSQDRPVKVASVEEGRKPGKMPPVESILLWVRRKLGGDRSVAFLVARSIGRKGTKGAGMFSKAFQERKGRVEQMWDKALDRLVRDL